MCVGPVQWYLMPWAKNYNNAPFLWRCSNLNLYEKNNLKSNNITHPFYLKEAYLHKLTYTNFT